MMMDPIECKAKSNGSFISQTTYFESRRRDTRECASWDDGVLLVRFDFGVGKDETN